MKTATPRIGIDASSAINVWWSKKSNRAEPVSRMATSTKKQHPAVYGTLEFHGSLSVSIDVHAHPRFKDSTQDVAP